MPRCLRWTTPLYSPSSPPWKTSYGLSSCCGRWSSDPAWLAGIACQLRCEASLGSIVMPHVARPAAARATTGHSRDDRRSWRSALSCRLLWLPSASGYMPIVLQADVGVNAVGPHVDVLAGFQGACRRAVILGLSTAFRRTIVVTERLGQSGQQCRLRLLKAARPNAFEVRVGNRLRDALGLAKVPAGSCQ